MFTVTAFRYQASTLAVRLPNSGSTLRASPASPPRQQADFDMGERARRRTTTKRHCVRRHEHAPHAEAVCVVCHWCRGATRPGVGRSPVVTAVTPRLVTARPIEAGGAVVARGPAIGVTRPGSAVSRFVAPVERRRTGARDHLVPAAQATPVERRLPQTGQTRRCLTAACHEKEPTSAPAKRGLGVTTRVRAPRSRANDA